MVAVDGLAQAGFADGYGFGNRVFVDRAAWDACVAQPDARTATTARTSAALAEGINSTPTIALNGGTPIPGLPDLDALIAEIRRLAGQPAGTLAPVPSAVP